MNQETAIPAVELHSVLPSHVTFKQQWENDNEVT